MKLLNKVLATAGAGVGVTAILLASTLPASAAAQGAGNRNNESITGLVTGKAALANAPVVPLQLRGVVNTRGSINLGGNSTVSGIWTPKGTLSVKHGNPNPPAQLNYRTCRMTDTITTSYTVVDNKSSGVFRNASGDGRALVVFSAVAPRYTSGKHKGQCNFSPNAQPSPKGAWISFQAQGPMALR